MTFDEMIRDSFRQNKYLALGDVSIPDIPLHPSRRFLRRMKRLQRNPKRFLRLQKRSRRPAIVRILLFALAGLSLAFLLLAALPEGRAWLASFSTRNLVTYESFDFDYSGVEQSSGPVVCPDPWLPDGYTLSEQQEDEDLSVTQTYLNEDGKAIHIRYQSAKEPLVVPIDPNGMRFMTVPIGDISGSFYASKRSEWPHELFWCDEETGTVVYLDGAESIPRMLRIAKSIAGQE